MMMRSSRVREETPQPTMRVTDGSSALSMIYAEETRPNMPVRADYQHTLVQRRKKKNSSESHAPSTTPLAALLSGIADSSL